jgi:PAS domain S-box-containing protein
MTESEELTLLRAEHRRTAQALEESRELFDSFVSHLAALAWMKDERGYYVYANRKFHDLAEALGATCPGNTDHDLWPAELADRLRAADERALDTSGAGYFSEVLPVPGGDSKVQIRLFQFVAKSGKRYVGGIALKDIAVKEKPSTMPPPISQCGLVGAMECRGENIVGANETMLAWLGLSQDELAEGGLNWRELTPTRYRSRDDEALADLDSRGSYAPYEKEFMDRQGKLVPVQICGVASGGDAERFTCSVLNLSDRKQVEARLLRAHKIESLGLIAGGVAHDFNNLLAIMGNTSIALDAISTAHPAFRPLTEVLTASRLAAELTQQVLAYSGRANFAILPVDLSVAVREIGGLLQTTISKKIDLRFNLPNRLPFIDADEGQIQQVIMNLVINASDAIGERPGDIVVSTDEIGNGEPGCQVCLEVRDTGCGMTPATQAQIFEPFFTTKANGRGIGLAAVREIVHNLRGELQVESQPGLGTIFRVMFPATDTRPAPHKAPEVRQDLWGNETILVADDDDGIRRMTHTALERLGYQVLLASNGEEAIQIFLERHREIAVVILDWAMPIMNGNEALKRILAIDPAATVLMSSGYAETETLERVGARLPAGFLQKPYTTSYLAERLREIIARRPNAYSQLSAETRAGA